MGKQKNLTKSIIAVPTRNSSTVTGQYTTSFAPDLRIHSTEKFFRFHPPLMEDSNCGSVSCEVEHSNSGKKVSIRFDSRYRIDFFDSIQFGNLINLPLVH